MSEHSRLEPFVSDIATPRVRFGINQLLSVGAEVERLGAERILLISTRSAAAAVHDLIRQLDGKQVDRFSEVAMHVPVELVARARQLAEERSSDLLLCVGGGSAIGLAKALAVSMKLPILAIPTTYAGSEMTNIWGRSEGGTKVTGRDPSALPRVVVYDPTLTLDFPPQLSSASGMNALAHSVEALYSPTATPITSMYAHESIGMLTTSLPEVVRDPRSLSAREVALCGAWLAGWSLNATVMGLHHKLCHVLGGLGLSHAGVHSALLPYVVSWVSQVDLEVTQQLATRQFNGRPPALGLWDLAHQLQTPVSLTDLGYSADHEDDVVRQVLADPPASRRPITEEAVREILAQASSGQRPTR